MAISTEDQFNLEVLKLLLNIAWVDGAVDQHEANMLLGLGRSWSVPEVPLQHLMETIKAGTKPSDPDYALLKQRPDEVILAARALVLSDGKVHPDEAALLKRVQAALQG